MSGVPKRALVTGGSAGLGAAMVRWLMANGFEVVALDPRGTEDFVAADQHIACDLASRADLDRALPEMIDAGPYNLVVFNAGIVVTGKYERIDSELHGRIVRVNAEAPMVIASALLTAETLNTPAALLFVSSLSHFTGYPGAASYAAAKDALTAYAKSMRKAARVRGVSITIAFPASLGAGHAERHETKAATASGPLDLDVAAEMILADALAGRKTSIPGGVNRAIAVIGRIAPKPVTALMRRLIFTRLPP